jgi:L-alanine-DL-glutamate epimerase-like enolase superfamily enzyme
MKMSIVESMEIYPVVGRDSMLLNLSGTHGPFFTRNVVILKDSSGATGLGDFKLKGGVFPGGEEMKAVRVLKDTFPDVRITLDPNSAWRLGEAISLVQGMEGILTYCGKTETRCFLYLLFTKSLSIFLPRGLLE